MIQLTVIRGGKSEEREQELIRDVPYQELGYFKLKF